MRIFAREKLLIDHNRRAIIAVRLGESRELNVDDSGLVRRQPSEHLPEIGGFKSVDEVLNRGRLLPFRPDDRNNVEACPMLQQPLFLQPVQSRFRQILLLFPGDGFGRMAELVGLSSLDLDKDNGVSVQADEVKLAPFRGKLTREDPHPFLFAQKPPGSTFATISKQLSQHARQG